MSAFSNRRGPAVPLEEFLNNLNHIPNQEPSPEAANYDDELAMFTNANFNDWDPASGELPQTQPLDVNTKGHTAMPGEGLVATPPAELALDFNIPDQFENFDFGTFTSPSNAPGFPDNLGNLQPLQPNPASVYQPGTQPNHFGVLSTQTGGKSHRQLSLEDQSRLAAEEDKRRRNTAASARFRVKKKAREQALEKREKELNDELNAMRNRITHLETENKWLRGLVMEKTGGNDDEKKAGRLTAFLKSIKESDSEEEPVKKKGKLDTEKAKC